jgi:hypothetical protein
MAYPGLSAGAGPGELTQPVLHLGSCLGARYPTPGAQAGTQEANLAPTLGCVRHALTLPLSPCRLRLWERKFLSIYLRPITGFIGVASDQRTVGQGINVSE